MSRQTTITVVTLLAVAAAAFLIYTRVIDQQSPARHEIVVCERCRNVFQVQSGGKGGGAPYKCPTCGEVDAYLAFQCQNPDCKTIFPVNTEALESGDAIVCPVCRAQARRLYRIPSNAQELARNAPSAEP